MTQNTEINENAYDDYAKRTGDTSRFTSTLGGERSKKIKSGSREKTPHGEKASEVLGRARELVKKMTGKPADKGNPVTDEHLEMVKSVKKLQHGKLTNEEVELDETVKKIGEYSHGANTTRVYKLTGDHDEGDPYTVKLFKNGKHYEPAQYFTNDHDDAHSTAKHMVKEDVDLDESQFLSSQPKPGTKIVAHFGNNMKKTGTVLGSDTETSGTKFKTDTGQIHVIHHKFMKLDEAKLPDWAQSEFDTAFPAKNKSKYRHDDDVARVNPKIDGHYKVQKFAKGRVNKGTYGTAVIDHSDEHPEGAPEKYPKHAGASEAMKVFGLSRKDTPSVKAAKTVTHGITTKQTSKPMSDVRRQAIMARLARTKDTSMSAKLRKQLGEDVEQLDELSGELLGRYIQKARTDKSAKIAHSKELDNLPKVKELKDKVSELYKSRRYNKRGESVHRASINKAYDKIETLKKKADPDYPKSTNWNKRYRGVEKAIDKLQHGKLTNEEVELDEGIFRATPKVKTNKYSWGTMKTIEHGHDFSIPLHPEHHQAIAKLNDGESHLFKDETKTNWTATRNGDNVNFKEKRYGYTTTVPHKDLKEDNELDESLAGMGRAAEYEMARDSHESHSAAPIKKVYHLKNEKGVIRNSYGSAREAAAAHIGMHPDIRKNFKVVKENVELEEGWVDHIDKIEVHHHGKDGYGCTIRDSSGKIMTTHHFNDHKSAKTKASEYHKTTGKETKIHDMTEEVDLDTEYDLEIVKEGFKYFYTISFQDEILKEGISVTESGALNEANRFIERLSEEIKSLETQPDRIKDIVNKYIK